MRDRVLPFRPPLPALRNARALLPRGLRRPRAHVLIACMPKSGSTFVSDVIAVLPGFRRAELAPAYGRRAQELDEACLQAFDRYDFVAQNHLAFSDWTAELCADYGLAPVVLVRDLLDVVVSLRDHLRNEGHVSPIFFAEAEHAQLSDEALALMIVRLALPWYLNFYMSWRQAPDALLVSYEDLVEAPAAVIRKILGFAGASVSPAEVARAIEGVQSAGGSRFNVGVAGRGGELPAEVVRAVLELVDFYPEAAADPFVRGVRARCASLLSDAPHPAAAPRPAARRSSGRATWRRWWRRNGWRVAVRVVAPVALAAAGVAYWLWPSDLIPDSVRGLGRLDDAAILLAAGLLAGRLTKHKPRGPRPRSDRPAWSQLG